MKRKISLVFVSCCMFLLPGFPALADSPFAQKRGEDFSRKVWKDGGSYRQNRSNDSNYGTKNHSTKNHSTKNHSTKNHSTKNHDRTSGHQPKINSWKREQNRSENSHFKSHRTSNERGQRPPDNGSGGDGEHRRAPRPSDKAPPQHQERREQRPEKRHNDHRPDKHPPPARHQEHRPEKRHRDQPHDTRRDQRHVPRHKSHYPPRHEPRHQQPPNHHHRPNYRLHKRHKYVYYRTPWYNTWFLAPILWPYYHIGYTLEFLPTPYVRIVVGSMPYYYASGTFYRLYGSGYIVVSAPIGAVVTTLPSGYIAFSMGVNTYYFVNDTYYVWDEPRDGFVVVPKPAGADDAREKATQGRLYVYPNDGQSEEQQAKDRYACHLWAVSESDVDPTLEEQDYSDREKREYKRAIAACLEGRGYTVK